MQTFSLVLDDASLLWVVVCLYSILSCHRFHLTRHLPAWENPPVHCLVSLKCVHGSFPVCFYPFTLLSSTITMPPLASLDHQ
ncbi:hypothetical protein B0H14DRAFT_2959437 [Mycena olivaceomarginata]|nr:hypothetical protein B0H14DRAFT_2959437 [Mycena olivaceomarginata]